MAAVDVILGMRESIQTTWQSLSFDEQRRFLRHLRPYWNAARHRLAPEINVQLRHALQTGSLRVAPGRFVESGDAPLSEPLQGEAGSFDLVFDCTGIRPDISNPLITSLVGQGLARPDAHGLGLMVGSDGCVARDGRRTPVTALCAGASRSRISLRDHCGAGDRRAIGSHGPEDQRAT